MKSFPTDSKVLLGIALLAGCLVAVSGCSKDNPTGPEGGGSAQYTGVWTGTTGQNLPVYFRINSAGVVDSLTVRIRMAFPTFTCTATFEKDTIVSVQGNTFVARVRYVGSSISTQVRATLNSSSSSSGTYDSYGGSFSIICGSTFSVGVTGSIISTGSWSATKTGQ